jgi:hypothetical protein
MMAEEAAPSFERTRTLGGDDLNAPISLTVTDEEMANKYQAFNMSRLSRVVQPYYPVGSLSALREQRKLLDSKTVAKDHARKTLRTQKSSVPGYTGFIRGKQQIKGRTHGDTAAMAYSKQYAELVRTSPIPSRPNANRHIPQVVVKNSFVNNNLSKRNHVPGYTGHVHGLKNHHGSTYGRLTEMEMAQFRKDYPRDNEVWAAEGYADTVMPRQLQHLYSTPLPGLTPNKNPKMCVEQYHKRLLYRSNN